VEPLFVLVPGAGGDAWYWHRLVPSLAARGAEAVAVDLPAADDAAGLSEYADTVVSTVAEVAGRAEPRVLVAQSMAGLSAPLVCERMPVALLVLVNAMVPLPGEPPGEWWTNVGFEAARQEQAARDGRQFSDDDGEALRDVFFHDVPDEVVAQAMALGEPQQSSMPFEQPSLVTRWPDVPTRVLATLDDRFFPVELQRHVSLDRLGIVPDEMPGGHLVALSRPDELADRLLAYWLTVDATRPADDS
jgi:pimeloyl-ACP methyl ester carboxylesterase